MDRPRQLVLPSITLDRRSSSPLHRQVSQQIACAIRMGAAGRLPSSRLLARLLGVSRNTVLTAYDELVADGFIQGRRGAAMEVRTTRTVGVPAVHRLLRDAQYPARTVAISDPDGSEIHLNYSR